MAALLLILNPSKGILFNALLYLPTIWWLWRAPYGPRFRQGQATPISPIRGLTDVLASFREVTKQPEILSMTLLAGVASLLAVSAAVLLCCLSVLLVMTEGVALRRSG